MLRPDQFVALRIYDLDTSREVVPDEAVLSRVAHVDLSQRHTKRIFKNTRYAKSGEPLVAKRLRHYAVARTGGGHEYALTIDAQTCALTIEGQPGCYYIEGASVKELVRIYELALGRVFIPRRLRPWTPDPGVPAPVRVGDKYGYADEYGKVVIDARFDDATPFSEGLAAVRVGGPEGGRWGYIDGTGGFVVELQFAGASFFSEGLAAVTVDDFFDGKQGYVNREGAMVIEPRFEEAWPFDGGTARVVYRKRPGDATEVRWINPEGDFVDPPGPR